MRYLINEEFQFEKVNNKLIVTNLTNKKRYYVISIVENDFLETLESRMKEAQNVAAKTSEFSKTLHNS